MDGSERAAKILKSLREKEEISQAALGDLLGRTKQTVSGAERAVRRFTIDRLEEYLHTLGYRLELVPVKETSEKPSEDYPIPSLKVVGESLLREEDFRSVIKEFYRYVAHTQDPCALYQEPPSVDPQTDAYLAAIAERVANHYDWAIPQWTKKENRTLSQPYYADAPAGMRDYLEEHSPPEFSGRNIFVDEDTVTGQLKKYREGFEEAQAAGQ